MSAKRKRESLSLKAQVLAEHDDVAETAHVTSPDINDHQLDEVEELATGINGHDTIVATSPSVSELQEEVESLEAVVQRLDEEKQALKMRLNEIEYYQRFSVSECKKWLAANYEFDRKDTPELLAGIFENYLLQNDRLDPLPHQLMVKNSSRAQSRRERQIHSRYHQVLGRERERPTASVTVKPAKASKTEEPSRPAGDPGTWGQHLYVNPVEIERLYALKPWSFIPDAWPKIPPSSKGVDISELVDLQDRFLQQNACALWERGHWFPIKQENGKTPAESKRLGTHHNRRKRRQAQLKERLEHLAAELRSTMDRQSLEQSIFGGRAVADILKRPKLWLPREDRSLIPQLHEIDEAEPDRNFHLKT
ncbi:hypothetical protein ATCC90586_002087 [Pythium insidiosum]|nr:hypothetical protein ATCC90586_002087 [Pythium insidiosum]